MLDNKVYVQINDFNYMLKFTSGRDIPNSVILKLFNDAVVCNDNTRYSFVEYTSQEEIQFFASLSYMVDYMKYRELTVKELSYVEANLTNEINRLNEIYEGLSIYEKMDQRGTLVTPREKLEFMKRNIMDIISYKQGKLDINLPIEVKETDPVEVSVSKKESKLKKIANKIRRR